MVTAEKQWIKRADVAGMIRKDLHRAFPGVKFSVRSRTYSIDVNWTDGPQESAVKGIIGAYEDRHFDGMIDMEYHIDHYMMPDGTISQWRSSGTQGSMGLVPAFEHALPAGAVPVRLNTGYLHTSREYSEVMRQRCLPLVPTNLDSDIEREQWLWRIMREQDGAQWTH